MKAVAHTSPGPIERDDSLVDIDIDIPTPGPRDLLVKIHAVSVNPADVKVRQMMPVDGDYKILGFDASGVVEAVGANVEGFGPGDEVYYSGSIEGQGTNAEYHTVDERIVGRKPATISHAEAAALPLTTLAAWEMLFDRLGVRRPTPDGGDLLFVIGGAGGVGSIAIQLARVLTDMTIIATASRPETIDWVKELGAHHVINHRELMEPQIQALGLGAPGFVLSTNGTGGHLADIAALIAPQGRFGPIDNVPGLDIGLFGMKSVSIHNELMFTRSTFQTSDMGEQGRLLTEVADLVDVGRITSTLTEVAGKIDAATMKTAHALVETGNARGKVVLEGF